MCQDKPTVAVVVVSLVVCSNVFFCFCFSFSLFTCPRQHTPTTTQNTQVCECLLRHKARLDCIDAQGNTVFHWCARRGHSSLPLYLVRQAERHMPGSSKGVMTTRNDKGKLCIDVCSAESVRATIMRSFGELFAAPPRTKAAAFRNKVQRAHR